MTATLRKSNHATRNAAAVTNTKAALYLRISDDREGRAVGVGRQRDDGYELATRDNLTIVAEFCDNDTGASTRSVKRRPDFEAMIARAMAGELSVIICYSSSRLTRRPRENEDLIELAERYGVRFIFCVSPSFDLNTADGRMIARMLAANDAAEAERTGERVQDESLARARRGAENGGQRAYAFPCPCPGPREITKQKSDGSTVTTYHEHVTDAQILNEVNIVRELTRRVVDGESVRGLARELRERAIPTMNGGIWSAGYVRDLVLRPRNVGLRVYQGEILRDADGAEVLLAQYRGDDAQQPIVARELWDAARAILTDPSRGRFYGKAPVHLLSGLATCWCGSPVQGGPGETYRGKTCAHLKRVRHHIDAAVDTYMISYLGRHNVGVEVPGTPLADDRAQLDAVRREVEHYEDAIVGDAPEHLRNVSAAGLNRKLTRLRAQLDELERNRAMAIVPGVLQGVTPQSWPALPVERRRAVVAELVTVTLLPVPPDWGRRPAPVEILPRKGD